MISWWLHFTIHFGRWLGHHTKFSFGKIELAETATNTMITLPKGMENGKMEKSAHIVFLHQRHHMKLFKDVRTQIGRFFILVVSASSNESIVSGQAKIFQRFFKKHFIFYLTFILVYQHLICSLLVWDSAFLIVSIPLFSLRVIFPDRFVIKIMSDL